MKVEREELESALAKQKELYETKLQEAMETTLNISTVSSSSSSDHSKWSVYNVLF